LTPFTFYQTDIY